MIFLSFDVTNMYSNIPINEKINILQENLSENQNLSSRRKTKRIPGGSPVSLGGEVLSLSTGKLFAEVTLETLICLFPKAG